MNLLQAERLRALAREYAMGSLRGGARRRFERLLRESEAARLEVAAWQESFARLAAAVPPMAPRDEVWQALQQRLGHAGAPGGAARRAPPPAEPARSGSAGWWAWLGGRTLAGALAGGLLTLVCGALLLQANPGGIGLEPVREELPASYVGLLSDAAGRPALLLSSRRHGRVLTAKLLQPLATPAGQVAVLWAYPKGGAAPFAVGTVAVGSGTASIPLADTSEKLFFHVERLGLSFEPTGPLPAAPSAPPALAGPCVKLW